jgi:competence protein ComFC
MFLPKAVGKPIYKFYKLAWAGLDWLYPPLCGGCGSSGSRWCSSCCKNTPLIPDSICRKCGEILKSPGECNHCQDYPPSYIASRSWAVFNGSIRNALHRLKYQGDIALGEILARPLVGMLNSWNWDIDVITAVPLGVARRKERGYNQSALLAIPLSLGSSKTYESRALLKIRETRSQVGLSLTQRRENVDEAFHARYNYVNGKSVLVVDDVTTSGATLEACSHALLDAGARQVYCLTLARTTLI